jgi:hypothetical protein
MAPKPSRVTSRPVRPKTEVGNVFGFIFIPSLEKYGFTVLYIAIETI